MRLVVPSSFLCGGGYLRGKGSRLLLCCPKMIGKFGKAYRAGRYMTSGGDGNVPSHSQQQNNEKKISRTRII